MTDSIISPTSGSRKNLPMIVDISIANDGSQIYQVHDSNDEDSTPSKKRSFDEIDSITSSHITDISNSSASIINANNNIITPAAEDSESEVWGSDVESAFEDALRIIPKNGLSKIKVSGRSCGRNELISDYILQQTGKLRTRKQVSSHIQVIKNIKKNQPIIDLINNGPSDPDSLKKFEQVFSKITFQKSIGNTTNTGSSINSMMGPDHKKPRRRVAYQAKHICEVSLKDFQMSCSNSSAFSQLSVLKSKEFDTNLKLKNNANISTRFPGLFELFTSNAPNGPIINTSIPSLHGMCKLFLPPTNQPTYNTSLSLSLKGLSLNESSWSVLTVIYSFGQEIVRLVDLAEITNTEVINGVKNVDLKVKFAPEFWDAFFTSLDKTNAETKEGGQLDDKHKDIAIRAITIKQLIFKSPNSISSSTQKPQSSSTGPTNILKKDIRTLVLWEFLKVEEQAKANTSIRRIHLINQMPMNRMNRVPQLQSGIPVHQQISMKNAASSVSSTPVGLGLASPSTSRSNTPINHSLVPQPMMNPIPVNFNTGNFNLENNSKFNFSNNNSMGFNFGNSSFDATANPNLNMNFMNNNNNMMQNFNNYTHAAQPSGSNHAMNYQQYMNLMNTPFTPSTTPVPSLHSHNDQAVNANIANMNSGSINEMLQCQEDLISRLESPIDLSSLTNTNTTTTHTNSNSTTNGINFDFDLMASAAAASQNGEATRAGNTKGTAINDSESHISFNSDFSNFSNCSSQTGFDSYEMNYELGLMDNKPQFSNGGFTLPMQFNDAANIADNGFNRQNANPIGFQGQEEVLW
ncbi:Tec1 protein [Saccharomycopsis crataegensis]|uniref:Tec1 protein n=1 Tax=Saccharomycopsis crataegensis TaxID=43959 RepID=A0AAV5QD59_9ASCO|nr:Tec1 protein [Saccharomycopsis crataegensis]